MVRRTPKPFTVEIRKSGRQATAAAASWPADPMTADEQPHVSWPGLEDVPGPTMETQDLAAAPVPTAGRVLLALDEPATPVVRGEPKQTHRARARLKPPVAEDVPAEMLAPVPADIVGSAVEHEPASPVSEHPDDAMTIVSGTPSMASALVLRHSRKRLMRSDFQRGERWKARLPIAALRRDRRKRTAP